MPEFAIGTEVVHEPISPRVEKHGSSVRRRLSRVSRNRRFSLSDVNYAFRLSRSLQVADCRFEFSNARDQQMSGDRVLENSNLKSAG